MATSIFTCHHSLPRSGNTDAKYRETLTAIKDALVGLGLVYVTNKSVDISTVLAPTSDQNYGNLPMVFAFNDSLQSTAPVEIEIWYGRGASTGTYLNGSFFGFTLYVKVSLKGRSATYQYEQTSNLGQFQYTPYFLFYHENAYSEGDTLHTCYASGNSSRLSLALFATSSCPFHLNVERTRDASGTEDGNGLHVFQGARYLRNNSSSYYYGNFTGFIPAIGPVLPAQFGALLFVPDTDTKFAYSSSYLPSSLTFSKATVYPYQNVAYDGPKNTMIGMMAAFTKDITPFTNVPVANVYGATRNYKPMNSTSVGGPPNLEHFSRPSGSYGNPVSSSTYMVSQDYHEWSPILAASNSARMVPCLLWE